MADTPLRIVHCLRAPVGGLFRHVCDLARSQAEAGHLVGIIADSSTGGDAAEERLSEIRPLCRLGIERFAMARIPGPGDLAVARKVEAVARNWAPDVLHGHGAKGGAYARIAGTRLRSGRKPVRAYTPHGGTLHYTRTSPSGFVFLSMERYLVRHTDVFLFESDYGRRMFEDKVGIARGDFRVVHNGVAPEEFYRSDPEPDAAEFLFVGELRQLKGIDTLLEALALLDRARRPAQAIIVGAGADRDKLADLAFDLGLAERVVFPGAMPARRAFSLGRCLVVPSRAESLPYIVLEAAAAHIPIVATHVGGIPEIFGPQAGRLVPPDDPPALAGAMWDILSNPEAAEAQSHELSERVADQFSTDRMANDILDAYISVM